MRGNIICDWCGRPLAIHGDRYVANISPVPAFPADSRALYNLCPQCANRLKTKLGRRRVTGQ